ncbi:MAG TPA: class I SAM-dependent methyltransferase, partial [Egibacteraceae bacterium]|nr:class I SAM-dependent methyltransferase [Egibacteraceae bacterium]
MKRPIGEVQDGRRTTCRSCGGTRLHRFLDLGDMPRSDALLAPEAVDSERRFPLQVAFCTDCTLVQILYDVPPPELFGAEYRYFSSYADALLAHAKEHAEQLVAERRLGADHLVVEIASNDGYLLQHVSAAGVRVLGVDPAPAQADAAEARGIPTVREFFDDELAARIVDEHGRADVVIANNVMAHVPDPNRFVAGMRTLLQPDGIVTVENPSVVELVDRCAFDTIYHEHQSYYSCTSVDRLFTRNGLRLVDVEEFPQLHGGTLRWTGALGGTPSDAVTRHLDAEHDAGVDTAGYYDGFARAVASVCEDLRALLRDLRAQGRSVAAYGAAAKGTILLNAAGLGTDVLDFVVDRNPHKHGLVMPGVHL